LDLVLDKELLLVQQLKVLQDNQKLKVRFEALYY